jgi:hypothetical protein
VLAIAGQGRIACNQVLYHLKERSIEHEVMPWCREHGVAVVAYSPLGSGRFPSRNGAGGQLLSVIAERHRATRQQVALRFLIREPGVFAIPKAARVEHVRENAKAAELSLSDKELNAIAAAFPARRRRGLADALKPDQDARRQRRRDSLSGLAHAHTRVASDPLRIHRVAARLCRFAHRALGLALGPVQSQTEAVDRLLELTDACLSLASSPGAGTRAPPGAVRSSRRVSRLTIARSSDCTRSSSVQPSSES